MVALDEQLGLAECMDVDAGRLPPGVVAAMAVVPLHDLTDPAADNLVEMRLGGLDVAMVAPPLGLWMAVRTIV